MTQQEFREWVICRLIGNIGNTIPGFTAAQTREEAIEICEFYTLEQLMNIYIDHCCWEDLSCIEGGLTYLPEIPWDGIVLNALLDISTAWVEEGPEAFYEALNKFCKDSTQITNKISIF